MDDKTPERGKAPPSLAAALRSARAEAAERSQSMADLRDAEMGRLDLLREALEPVLAHIPADVDLFDTGIVPGEHPRLFIDMIAFVDMARDRRTYRFHHDTRNGRVLLAETESLAAITGALTDYIARRLVERERALAALAPEGIVLAPDRHGSAALDVPAMPASPVPSNHPAPRGALAARLLRGLRFAIEGLGVLALVGLVWLGLHYVEGFAAW